MAINDLKETDEKFVINRIYEDIKNIQARIEHLSKIVIDNYSSEEIERMMSKALK